MSFMTKQDADVIKLNVRNTQGMVNARASFAGGLGFKFRAGQILHSVANGSPPLQHLCK